MLEKRLSYLNGAFKQVVEKVNDIIIIIHLSAL